MHEVHRPFVKWSTDLYHIMKCILPSHYQSNNCWNLTYPFFKSATVHPWGRLCGLFSRILQYIWSNLLGTHRHGDFGLQTCYEALMENHPSQLDFQWIWRLHIPPKIKHFLWFILFTAIYYNHISCFHSPNCSLCDAVQVEILLTWTSNNELLHNIEMGPFVQSLNLSKYTDWRKIYYAT